MSKYILSENVLFQKVSDEMVLLDLDAGEYFGLNDVGTRVIELLKEGKETEDILEDLQRSFEVEPEELRRDISALLDDLADNGLIRAG